MTGKGETFENSSGGKSATLVRDTGGRVNITVVNDQGTQKTTLDKAEAAKLHEQLGKVLGKK